MPEVDVAIATRARLHADKLPRGRARRSQLLPEPRRVVVDLVLHDRRGDAPGSVRPPAHGVTTATVTTSTVAVATSTVAVAAAALAAAAITISTTAVTASTIAVAAAASAAV